MPIREHVEWCLLFVVGIGIGAEGLALIQKYICHMW